MRSTLMAAYSRRRIGEVTAGANLFNSRTVVDICAFVSCLVESGAAYEFIVSSPLHSMGFLRRVMSPVI